uniref:Cytochrome b n=1 Tax=Dimorphostylis asiatica TaxID=2840398 RepID=A0A8F8AGR5_9CRUS|nr:cytochrome b [Dimorphostylis asiatica]
MKMNFRKTDSLVKIINSSAVDLATPLNISRLWNFGFMLFMCLLIQLVTGIFLVMDYSSTHNLVFFNLAHTMMDMNNGWLIRNIHASGASLFFLLIYCHIGRGMYHNSFFMKKTWMSGVTILLMLMATAFLGYVLPWGQMSFWGATVITNLFSAIPVIGNDLVQYLWGGFSINNPTLKRFFTLHFLLPFILTFLAIIHVFFLHETGSSNPLGLTSKSMKTSFHPYSSSTDMESLISLMFYMILMCLLGSLFFVEDPDNFNPANPLMAPPHIQPEWYFLFAYAILRSIPNKLGGVISLAMSVLILYILPFTFNKKFKSSSFNPLTKVMFWILVTLVLALTWIGARPVEMPFVFIGQMLTMLYFSYFVFNTFTDSKL